MSSQSDHEPIEEPVTRRVSQARAMIVVIAVLALMVVVFPAGLANWLDEKCYGNWFCDGISSGLRSVESAWDAIGLADIRDGASSWLREVTGIPDQ
jgi:hypothetical protein